MVGRCLLDYRLLLYSFLNSQHFTMSQSAPSWNDILSELNRDVSTEQPSDVVQWGADWFQARLRKDVSDEVVLKGMRC